MCFVLWLQQDGSQEPGNEEKRIGHLQMEL